MLLIIHNPMDKIAAVVSDRTNEFKPLIKLKQLSSSGAVYMQYNSKQVCFCELEKQLLIVKN